MNYIVFDLETQNIFQEVGSNEPADLDISVATLYDSSADKYTTATIDNLEILWPIIEDADTLVGYNSNHFDIPLLNKYYPGNLTEIKSIDLLEAIRESLGRRIRLDNVAEATIGAKKSADGLAAVRWWRAGEVEKVKQYCEQDVKVTKEVFEYALEHNRVFYLDSGQKKEIPLITTDWDKASGSALTHSLPF